MESYDAAVEAVRKLVALDPTVSRVRVGDVEVEFDRRYVMEPSTFAVDDDEVDLRTEAHRRAQAERDLYYSVG